jgi:hypothetical protein
MNDIIPSKSTSSALTFDPPPKTKAERQAGWRHRNLEAPDDPGRKGVGVTVHLREEEIAVLDWIARGLWYGDPIGKGDEPTKYVPSRAEAIRDLITRYIYQYDERIPLEEMIDHQAEWGQFWVREASWRRASVRKKVAGLVLPPRMPALTP